MAEGQPAPEKKRKGLPALRFGGELQARRAGEREALILGLICTLDMITTLWWVIFGQATEANSVLSWTFKSHPATFVLVKCATCLPALILAPRLAERRKTFTVWLLRAIIVAYVGLYFANAQF